MFIITENYFLMYIFTVYRKLIWQFYSLYHFIVNILESIFFEGENVISWLHTIASNYTFKLKLAANVMFRRECSLLTDVSVKYLY